MKRKYGDQSINALKFKKYCADAYDGSFSYRFLYRFRNYAQHCGLPLTKISFDARSVENGSERVDRSLNIGVDRNDLLEAGFNWGVLRSEIASQPEVIEISIHVGQMMDRLRDIHTKYITDEFIMLGPHASRLRGLTQNIPDEVKELHLFKLSIDPSDPTAKVNWRMQVVPMKLVEDVFDERFAILFEEEPDINSP